MQNPIENGDRVKIHERLATLETQVEAILTNHLPHIQASIDIVGDKLDSSLEKINNKINWLFLTAFSAVIALVVNLIKDKF